MDMPATHLQRHERRAIILVIFNITIVLHSTQSITRIIIRS